MRCFSVILGARNAPAAGRRFARRDDQLLQQITARHFPTGFTIMNTQGGWFDPKAGRFRAEESRQIIVCCDRIETVMIWSKALGRAFRQQELLLFELGLSRRVKIASQGTSQAPDRTVTKCSPTRRRRKFPRSGNRNLAKKAP